MSTQSYSSIGAAGRRRGTAHDDIDRSFYAVGQTLASIVNDPRAPSQSGGFWGLASEATQLPAPPAPLDPAKYPPVSKADLQRYIQVVHGAYDKFVRDRQSLEAFDAQHQGRRASGALRLSLQPNCNCGPNCCWYSSRQQLHLLLIAATKQQHVGTLLVLSPRQQPHTTPQRCSRAALLRPCPVCDCAERLSSSSSSGGQQHQGEPFMVAVQAVPSQFFQEGFFDDW